MAVAEESYDTFYGAFELAECEESSPPDYRVAKAVCVTCPVRWDCLDEALANREKHGVWGGLTEHQRKRLMRRRQDWSDFFDEDMSVLADLVAMELT